MAASATTRTRLTANPCPAAKVPNAFTSDDRKRGWEVCAMPWTMLARLPGFPPTVPDQNPLPGHAWSSAIPARNRPVPPSTARPSRGPGPGPVGQRDERPGHGVQERRSRGAE